MFDVHARNASRLPSEGLRTRMFLLVLRELVLVERVPRVVGIAAKELGDFLPKVLVCDPLQPAYSECSQFLDVGAWQAAWKRYSEALRADGAWTQ